MARLMEQEQVQEPEEEEGPKVLNSEFFSGPRLARRKQVLQEMRGRMHRGHR
jgi:hypothetical protein